MSYFDFTQRSQRNAARRRVLVAAVTAALATRCARASGDTFIVPSGSWSTASNWSAGTLPGVGSLAVIPSANGSVATVVTFDNPFAWGLGELDIGTTNGASATLNEAVGYLNADTAFIGRVSTNGVSTAGFDNLYSGSQGFGLNLTVGGTSTAGTSTLAVSGNGLLVCGTLNVGTFGGNGFANQSGGTIRVSMLNVGAGGTSTGGVGTYTLTGGVLTGSKNGTNTVTSGIINVGNNGVGSLTQTGGVLNISSLNVGFGGTGTFTLTGGSVTTSQETIGNAPSTFAQSGGVNATGPLTITNGSYTLSGSAVLTAGSATMNARSSFTLTGGTATVRSLDFALAKIVLAGGNLTVSGALSSSSTFSTVSISAGTLMTGTSLFSNPVIQTGGTHLTQSFTASNYSLSGGLLNTGTGLATLNTFTQTGGVFIGGPVAQPGQLMLGGTGQFQPAQLTVSNLFWLLGPSASASVAGDLTVTPSGRIMFPATGGGSLTVSGTTYLTAAGENVYQQVGRLSASHLVVGTAANATATYDMGGNATLIADVEDVGSGTASASAINQSGGANLVTSTLRLNGGSYKLSGTPSSLYVGDGATTGETDVGTLGHGSFTHGGGVASLGALHVGVAATAVGDYTLNNGGTMSATSAVVGEGGLGSLSLKYAVAPQLENGVAAITGALTLGRLPTGTGLVAVSGSSILNAGSLYLGGDASGPGGVGILTLSGGTTTIAGGIRAYATSHAGTNVTGIAMSRGVLAAASFANDAPFVQTGGSATLGTVSGTGTLAVGGAAGALLTVSGFTQTSVTVTGGGTVRVTSDGLRHTNAAAVTLTGGSLDLADQDLLTPTPASSVRAFLAAGYARGNWNGASGIISSTASSVGGSLAYASADDAVAPGVAIPSGQTLVRLAVPGDANLSGVVDSDDFETLQANFGKPGDWTQGDFNYDGVVNFSDFLIFQNNFNRSLDLGDSPGAAPLLSVPEPASAALSLGFVATTLRQRRRRRSRQPRLG